MYSNDPAHTVSFDRGGVRELILGMEKWPTQATLGSSEDFVQNPGSAVRTTSGHCTGGAPRMYVHGSSWGTPISTEISTRSLGLKTVEDVDWGVQICRMYKLLVGYSGTAPPPFAGIGGAAGEQRDGHLVKGLLHFPSI